MAQSGSQQSNTDTPSWPSLYDLGVEVIGIQHHNPIQPGGAYLHEAHDIFRFTLYWTLIFYTPIFLACGAYAFLNLSFPPNPPKQEPIYPLSPLRPNARASGEVARLRKTNVRRSRVTFTTVVLLVFLVCSVAGAVMGSAVIGFVAAGLFRAAKYNMSTWIPFLCSVIYVSVGLLSIWPSIINII